MNAAREPDKKYADINFCQNQECGKLHQLKCELTHDANNLHKS